MQYKKGRAAAFCAAFLFLCGALSGCGVSLAGITLGGKDELVFSCAEEELSADSEETSASEPAGTSAPEAAEEETDGKVDLNSAGLKELMTLNGIGETRARAILEYRSQNGPFAAPEDIMQVPGIKEGIFEKLKNQITVR